MRQGISRSWLALHISHNAFLFGSGAHSLDGFPSLLGRPKDSFEERDEKKEPRKIALRTGPKAVAVHRKYVAPPRFPLCSTSLEELQLTKGC